MIRTLRSALPLALLLAGCVTTNDNPHFNNDQVSMAKASQDNVALGMQYMQQGNRDVAMQKIQKAIQQDPDNANAYMAEAILYSTIGDPQRADDAYKIALRKGPDNPELQNNYAVFLCQNKRPKDAVGYFLKAAANPMYSTPDAAYANAGVCAGYIPDPAASEQYFRKALDINPYFPVALYQLALLDYQQKKYLSARAFIERLTGMASQTNGGYKLTPDLLLLAVRNERALKNPQGAADYAKQLMKLFPGSDQAQQLGQADPHG